ncbi:GntR family transcriptional regulator [Paenibacillus sp. Marseille-Q4541]|uniref:GntR family transcriptional regulator n=1 Tax=Paenibacillus sp. Marseille-Q4541 TaxID=2831522 RepID=UPI001BA4BD9B|nr:GntR family transcriptional regulator [Paenibacillus sp. Marseille-Q4541]
MIIELDMQSELPIYTQLTNQIIEGIASGALAPGEALPSVRSLASDIGINLHTVNKAYQLLKQEDYIHIHRQKGVVVNPNGMPAADQEFTNKQCSQIRPLIAEGILRGVTLQEMKDMMEQIYDEIKPM